MKKQKMLLFTNIKKQFFMLIIVCISIFTLKLDARAATQGTIPCSEGSVTWTLDDEGVLTFSGNGTTDIMGEYGIYDWTDYWNDTELVKKEVLSVKVKQNSQIVLDTCKYMFLEFINCTQIDLIGFNTSNVTSMYKMFYDCESLTEVDVRTFNTGKVTNMSQMFNGCESLTELDIRSFDTSQVTDMSWMFNGCEVLTELDVRSFDTSQVTDMSRMFRYCNSLMELDVRGFDTSQVTDMSFMFRNCYLLKELDVRGFDTSQVTDMSYMFAGCKVLKELDVSGFSTRKVTDMSSMFAGCEEISKLDLRGFDTSKVTDMSFMFGNCSLLKELDLRGLDTSQVTNMKYMFGNCSSLTGVDVRGFDTSKVKDMSFMFGQCRLLTELDVSGFETSQVIDMSDMFKFCNLTELDVRRFDTSKVTNMSGMFNGCDFTEIDLRGFDTSQVTDMSDMLSNCLELKELDVSGFDTGKVTNMSCMFFNCIDLNELDVRGFDTSQVTDMSDMFASCRSLKELDINNFDTSKVTDMSYMFANCVLLKELDINNFDTSKVASMKNIFAECESLNKLVTPKTQVTIELPIISDDRLWIDNNKNIYSADEYTFQQSTELYGVKENYNIHYVTEATLINCPNTYSVLTGLSNLGTAEIKYHTFDGWYTDEACTKPITSIEKGTYGDITLYAKMIPLTYQITYKNIEDSTNIQSLPSEYTYGTNFTLPQAQKNCYAFQGWYTDEALTIQINNIPNTSTGDITLYAKWEESHEVDKTNGTITKPVTTTETGKIQYKCKNCSYTITEELPKLPEEPKSKPEITDKEEETITNITNDADVKGSSFVKIQAKADKTTKNSIRLTWNKVKDADGYFIYGNKCNKKNKYLPIKTISNNKKTSYTLKKLKKGTYYKYIVRAYKLVEGKKKSIAVSKTIHATTTGGKNGNAKAVKVNKTKVTLKKNKTFKIKASEIKQSKKISRHRNIAYESSDKKIATVSKKGVIKGKKKGTCYVYAYAQNGVYKKIKVTVK